MVLRCTSNNEPAEAIKENLSLNRCDSWMATNAVNIKTMGRDIIRMRGKRTARLSHAQLWRAPLAESPLAGFLHSTDAAPRRAIASP